MRMKFFSKYILQRSAGEYKSGVEKDWAYVARAEYRHDVNTMAILDGMAAGTVASMVRMFMLKRFAWWPFVPMGLAVYFYRSKQLFVLHNKKYFDMCNVGEQYEIGYARNVVLRKCNHLVDREDF